MAGKRSSKPPPAKTAALIQQETSPFSALALQSSFQDAFSKVATIIGFAAGLASAVDIVLHSNNRCSGGVLRRCNGINPGSCCGDDRPSFSIGFLKRRTASCFGYTDTGCRTQVVRINSNNNEDVCMRRGDGGRIQSGRWQPLSAARRGLDARDAEVCAAGQEPDGKCESPVRPDELELADGSKFDLKGLDDAKYNQLTSTSESVPEEFESLRITASQ
ncbi:hypothetical protein RB599_004377 [Gaeumannomyces hyphopodioides]